jgi:hypothetical protein
MGFSCLVIVESIVLQQLVADAGQDLIAFLCWRRRNSAGGQSVPHHAERACTAKNLSDLRPPRAFGGPNRTCAHELHANQRLAKPVIVDELDVAGAAGTPGEADAPLVVDADALLAGASADEFLQPIARRHSQVVDALSGVDENQLAADSGVRRAVATLHRFTDEG